MYFTLRTKNSKLLCKELTVKQYKDILKCTYGDEPEKETFIETVCCILSELTDKPVQYFKDLNVVELFSLILQIRVNSVGESCFVGVLKNGKQMKLELNLQLMEEDIRKVFDPFSSTLIKQKNIEVVFDSPSIERLLSSGLEEEYLYFVKEATVTANKKKKTIKISSNEEASVLFQSLSPKVSLEIIQKFEDFFENIMSVNLLKRYEIDEQKLMFLPSLESVLWFTKLLFNESLETFYDNMFYLCHLGHFNLEYVESCSPGEYLYLVRKLEAVLVAQNPKSSSEENFSGEVPQDLQDSGFSEPAV